MAEQLFSSLELEPESGDTRAGYRLHRLEVYNWGTFDGRVSTLVLDGHNTLLTGDIGSGKSTLIDAVTTLLLPSQRISYNKAAGADTRERDLRSYVLGHYKSERVESTGSSRPIGLRDHTSYSVLLGVFRNEGYGEDITLAQVFWVKDTSAGQPVRFYVTAPREMSIASDFADFGSDLGALKRRLRASGVAVEDSFPPYGQQVRRLLGIQSPQAMELFHQTVSMKSVGNLDDFVRRHMLEPADPTERIKGLVAHFQDLTAAHDAVRRAKDQLAHLEPMLRHCEEHDDRGRRVDHAQAQIEALRSYVAQLKVDLLTAEHAGVGDQLAGVEHGLTEAEQRKERLAEETRRLHLERQGAGGDRLGELERLIDAEQSTRTRREERAARHSELLALAGLDPVDDAESFRHRRSRLDDELGEVEHQVADADNRLNELAVERHGLDQDSRELSAEIRSLRERPSNIPVRNVEIRDRLCEALGLAPDVLPFAGELVQVRAEHRDWQGAAERVLRSFALSLLVPNEHYAAVSEWINGRHLGARVVYYRVSDRRVREPREPSQQTQLVDLLEIGQGPFAEWLEAELARRAAHVCAPDLEVFARERRAVTINGLVKSPDGRHEKDDRSRIDDRSRFVLGWSNEQKVDALVEGAASVQSRITTVDDERRRLDETKATAGGRQRVLTQLAEYREWADLDWRASVAAISRWEEEQAQLLARSSRLAEVDARLRQTETDLRDAEKKISELRERRGGLDDRGRHLESAVATQRRIVAQAAEEVADLEARHAAVAELLADRPAPPDVDACDDQREEVAADLERQVRDDRDAQHAAAQRAVKAMTRFRAAYPDLTSEMDADMAATGDYTALRDRLAGDDLPRFEKEFKKQLNTNTINDLAGFYGWLRRESDGIHERIATINSSLEGIDYNPGRFIRLEIRRTAHQEIKDFQSELRACTDDALGNSEQYSEERFLRVKAIVERLQGREGFTETDRRWTDRVTDVRNWFGFAASERWRETGEEWEHYADSDGKSGGQKEKLAYTVLAASLAYQFKLEWGAPRSRDFRFAVIDEAFGRGSDVSTRYALGLFRRLGLQLLIVTPLQKVHVIEPFVRSVGFVANRTGDSSRLQSLTIEEYAEQRAQHLASMSAAPPSDGLP